MPTPIIPMTALASRENLLSATQLALTTSAMARQSASPWALDLPQA